jgi:acyl-CoA synthetase (NDP forming)
VRKCIAKPVRGLVVISAGFSEVGGAGRDRERELKELLQRANIPMIGPNCLGVLNADPATALNGTFSLPRPPVGNVAVLTQSGALGFVFPEYMQQWGLGISQMVSIGNKLDVGENALLDYWGDDPATRVIQVYLESFQDPRRFLEIAQRVTRTKPVVALNAGRTGAGERAAGSHTAALASPSAAADGMFRQAGVIRVDNLEELFESTAILATQPLPKGRRVAVLTNAGGPGVLGADALEARGLVLPEFSAALQSRLREHVPAEAAVRNPIDLIGTTDAEQFRWCLDCVLASSEVDSVVVMYVPRLADTTPAIVTAVSESASSIAHGKTLLTVIMEAEWRRTDWQSVRSANDASVARTAKLNTREPENARTDCQSVLQATSIPCFRYPEGAARALRSAVDYAEWLARPAGTVPVFDDICAEEWRQIPSLVAAQDGDGAGWLPPHEVLALLECWGLPAPPWSSASSADEAVAAAEEIGYPIVVKAISPTVLHKSDVGGVALDVRNAEELNDAYRRVRSRIPDSTAVLIQPLVRGCAEVLIGVKNDPAFGHLIGFGLGGVLVEALHDVKFRLHPLTDRDADDLIRESFAAQLLQPHRGRPAGDAAALREALLRVSALVTAMPEIEELDLNPVSVLPEGQGVRVLDARVHIGYHAGRISNPSGSA